MSASEANLGGLPIAAGDVLLKKYRIERLIGEGGAGIVVSATHLELERRVAIKFLRRALADDELRIRFEREARAIGAIESDHVVRVLEAGSLDDGALYMVIEYLDGRDLARVVKEDGPLPIDEAVDCVLQVCEALRQAHTHGIVHRDLKPANLLLTRKPDGQVHVKVVDFGISKILDKVASEAEDEEGPEEVTAAYTILGSPRWMAPEQLRNSKEVDGRADLWSVGVVLFQLISGQHAFDVEGPTQAGIAAVLNDEPRRLADLVPSVPKELDAVVSKCLAKDVTQRFQTATELAGALRPFATARTKDALDRITSAKRTPGMEIGLSSTSRLRAKAHAVREVLAESRSAGAAVRVPKHHGDARGAHVAPPSDQGAEPPLPSRAPSRPVLGGLVAGGLLLALGVFAVERGLYRSSPSSVVSPGEARGSVDGTLAAPAKRNAEPPSTLSPDAGGEPPAGATTPAGTFAR